MKTMMHLARKRKFLLEWDFESNYLVEEEGEKYWGVEGSKKLLIQEKKIKNLIFNVSEFFN